MKVSGATLWIQWTKSARGEVDLSTGEKKKYINMHLQNNILRLLHVKEYVYMGYLISAVDTIIINNHDLHAQQNGQELQPAFPLQDRGDQGHDASLLPELLVWNPTFLILIFF